jgi:hypothetical protein
MWKVEIFFINEMIKTINQKNAYQELFQMHRNLKCDL